MRWPRCCSAPTSATLPDRALPSGLEVSALLRLASDFDGFGTVLRRGDADRGTILLILASRGTFCALFESFTDFDGDRKWRKSANYAAGERIDTRELTDRYARMDPDFWLIELDIAAVERFTDEMGLTG